LAPFFLASLKAIAIACFRLFTFRPEPLFNVPRFLRRIADSTFFDADRPYFAITCLRRNSVQALCWIDVSRTRALARTRTARRLS
jgi:hypothetical protein